MWLGLRSFYEKIPSIYKKKIEYENFYHEILFEPESDKVYKDMLEFFDFWLKNKAEIF